MTANWTLTTISVWDEQRITPVNKVAMKFLGTTTVVAPIVLIILTIWMGLAFASPASASPLQPACGLTCLRLDEGIWVDRLKRSAGGSDQQPLTLHALPHHYRRVR